MKELIIKIPETKVSFVIELMNQLGIEVAQKYDIPEEHLNIVRERITKSELDPDRIENWDVAKKKLKLDS